MGQTRQILPLLTIAIALAWLAEAAASGAAATAGTQAHLKVIVTECRGQLGLGAPECLCVSDRVVEELNPLEIEYVAARISANDAEVERLREVLRFGERMVILWKVTRSIEDCADGAPINNPL